MPRAKACCFPAFAAVLICLGAVLASAPALADSARGIDVKVDAALQRLRKQVGGADALLSKAVGVLVFPRIFPNGALGSGGGTGEGALRIDGKSAAYYIADLGFRFHPQGTPALIVVFLDKSRLQQFRASEHWSVGTGGSVALVEPGAGGELNSANLQDPVVGLVFGDEGLMSGLTLEGSAFRRVDRK